MLLRRALFALVSIPLLAAGCSSSDEPEEEEGSEGALTDLRAQSRGPGEFEGSVFLDPAPTAFQRGRPGLIRYVIIHDIEGPAEAGVNTFQAKNNEASSHYIVDKNGGVIQMVKERDVANHANHSLFNAYAIGIEHGGFMKSAYPREEYEGSAKLVAYLLKKYRIPVDRAHVIGHYQIPRTEDVVVPCGERATNCGGKTGHGDPGAHWDWDLYMRLVTQAARAIDYDTSKALPDSAYPIEAQKPVESVPMRAADGSTLELVGGFWATQCLPPVAGAPQKQVSFRTISDGNPRIESRYVHPVTGGCGGDAVGGAYPIVFSGYTTEQMGSFCAKRGEISLKAKDSVGKCLTGKPDCLESASVCAADGDDCVRTAVMALDADAARASCH